ncbi:MAG TPA: hypothetical protein VN823_27240 [Stellaceae bacterium]|nr:hypothetical protein [Stellaceae bacterium]
MQIVIFDSMNPRPYSRDALQRGALGGTEASAVRVAEQLDAVVIQREVLPGDDQFLPSPRVRAVVDPISRCLPSLREQGERALARMGYLDAYWEKVNAWQTAQRPHVSARPEFRLGAVASSWRRLLNDDGAFRP